MRPFSAPTGSARAAVPRCRRSAESPYRGPYRQRAGRAPTAATRPSLTSTAPSAATAARSPIASRRISAGLVLITDRGIEHARNEDAAAAGILVGSDTERPDAIAVAVCDGVSASDEAHTGRGRRLEGGCGCDARRARRVPQGTRGGAGGSRGCGEGGGRGRGRSRYGAVVHVYRGDSRPDFCWDSTDHGR